MSSMTEVPAVVVPRVPCRPWCDFKGETVPHFNVEPKDQCCYSQDLRIDLSLHPSVEESYLRDGEYVPGPDHIEISAQQGAEDASPLISMRRESDDQPFVEWKFTPAEAQQTVEALQLLLGQIEAAR